MNHRALCDIALKWLKRPNSAGGHGCQIALIECRTGWDGEIPDAIGFRATGHEPTDGSVVVEVKVSRQDFLADSKKTHRQSGGVGRWRYFMTPKGLIDPTELPARWGLLEVSPAGRISAVAGPATLAKDNFHHFRQSLHDHSHERDLQRELFLLVKTMANTGDPQKVLDMLRDANNRNARLAKSNNDLRSELARHEWMLFDNQQRGSDKPMIPIPRQVSDFTP